MRAPTFPSQNVVLLVPHQHERRELERHAAGVAPLGEVVLSVATAAALPTGEVFRGHGLSVVTAVTAGQWR